MGTMENGSGSEAALCGIKDGVAWVAEDSFVTRRNDELLVERWVGRGVRSITVREASDGIVRALWLKLSEIAMDETPTRPST